jgi:hypothetical protein
VNINNEKKILDEPFNFLDQTSNFSFLNNYNEVSKIKNDDNKNIINTDINSNIPSISFKDNNDLNYSFLDYDCCFDLIDKSKANKTKEKNIKSNDNNDSFTFGLSSEHQSNSKKSNNNSYDNLFENENEITNKKYINFKNVFHINNNDEDRILDRIDQIGTTLDLEKEGNENYYKYIDDSENEIKSEDHNIKLLSKKRINQDIHSSPNSKKDKKDKYRILEIIDMKVPLDYDKGIKLSIKYEKNNDIYYKEVNTKYDYIPNDKLIKYYEMFIHDIYRNRRYNKKVSFD